MRKLILLAIILIVSCVSNSNKFMPDRCKFGPQVNCDPRNMMITSGGDGYFLVARLTNNIGQTVYVDDFDFNPLPISGVGELRCEKGAGLKDRAYSICFVDQRNFSCPLDSKMSGPIEWREGEGKNLLINSENKGSLPNHEKMKFQVSFSYSTAQVAEKRVITGEIFSVNQGNGNGMCRIEKTFMDRIDESPYFAYIVLFVPVLLIAAVLFVLYRKK